MKIASVLAMVCVLCAGSSSGVRYGVRSNGVQPSAYSARDQWRPMGSVPSFFGREDTTSAAAGAETAAAAAEPVDAVDDLDLLSAMIAMADAEPQFFSEPELESEPIQVEAEESFKAPTKAVTTKPKSAPAGSKATATRPKTAAAPPKSATRPKAAKGGQPLQADTQIYHHHQPYHYPAYHKPTYPSVGYATEPDAYASYPETYCDPKAVPKCAANSTTTWCLVDDEYPVHELKYAIEYDSMALKKYADVSGQSANDLVQGFTKKREEALDYSFYNGQQFDKGNWVGGEGFICPSDVGYVRPLRAKNVDGEWRVIVQAEAWPAYPQTQRIESCLYPGAACRTLAPCYHSQCLQKYVYHRMLSFNPCDPHHGLFIDIYKLPSACSCHIPATL